ncbi:hypothetical protein P8452_47501 [Trifolium repens]|nr:hypothetical protein P8452_47501 [Trifolium repens]
MQTFRKITTTAKQFTTNLHLRSTVEVPAKFRRFSSRNPRSGEDEWNEAWESAWLPQDLTPKTRAPWESDVNFASEADAETKAFVEEMNENWDERRKGLKKEKENNVKVDENGALYSLENIKKDYRLKKQKLHAGLWTKEIEKLEEAKLGDSGVPSGDDDIQRLLDSCSDIFDSGNNDLNNAKVETSEFKNMPDGWETISKNQDGNIWEMSQREEDILMQEFERRIAYSKFQIASFIKTHIFSRRRPIDGWKYMIEVVGPNAKRGKGSVSRVPSLSDPSTQPFKEEKTSADKNHIPLGRR